MIFFLKWSICFDFLITLVRFFIFRQLFHHLIKNLYLFGPSLPEEFKKVNIYNINHNYVWIQNLSLAIYGWNQLELIQRLRFYLKLFFLAPKISLSLSPPITFTFSLHHNSHSLSSHHFHIQTFYTFFNTILFFFFTFTFEFLYKKNYDKIL